MRMSADRFFLGILMVMVAIGAAGCNRSTAIQASFTVEGMHCEGCSSAITDALVKVVGVESASADHVRFRRGELSVAGGDSGAAHSRDRRSRLHRHRCGDRSGRGLTPSRDILRLWPLISTPRAAYVLTKIAVFAVAAALTWPLARVIGPKAWWGLGFFGLILAALTAVVFLAFGRDATDGWRRK